MSDKAEKKKDAAPGDAKEAKKKGGIGALLTKLPVLLGGVMVIEAVVLFGGFKMLSSGPKSADASVHLSEEASAEGEHGTEPAADDGHGAAADTGHGDGAAADAKPKVDAKKQYEMVVVEFRAPNKGTGRTFLYDVSIYAVVKGANKTKVENAIKERGALIKDRVRTIIAQSDPEKLGGGSEPGLETLRRQVKFQLDEIIGDGYVDEVLVPRCIPFRTDF